MVKRILFIITLLFIFWLPPTSSYVKPNFHYRLKKIVIDAGHGGKDSGCKGHSSKEKDIALNIALKLGNQIKANLPEVEVLYTRSKDVFIELHERAAIANRSNADLFLSIHCNASKDDAFGTETYIMGVDKTRENLAVARRENSVILLENDYGVNYDGFDPDLPESHIIFSLHQNAHLQQSIKLASLVENQFKHQAKRKSRGVKQQSFLVLYKTAMPSVLIEAGFLTNQSEENYLASEEGQSYIASAIYRAFKSYKTTIEDTPEIAFEETDTSCEEEEQIEKLNFANIEERNLSITYRIQLYNAYQSVDLGKPNFDLVEKIDIEESTEGVKQYLLSQVFDNYDAAEQILDKVQKGGFKYARIIPYQNGERVTD